MAFMGSMRDRISHAGQSTVQKAKDLSEVAKLNTTISDAEYQIGELYGKIGYEVYRAYYDRPLPEVAELISDVTALHQTIESCKTQINAINSANTCPNCGAKIKPQMAFCSGCGFRLPLVERPAVPNQTAFCTNCGKPIAPNMVFCTFCGNKVK